jgi:putative toxin-antitoxin system antitoxin component (TIGR02293 family)
MNDDRSNHLSYYHVPFGTRLMNFATGRIIELLGFAEAQATWPRVEKAIRAGLPKSALLNVVRLIEPEPAQANELAFTVVAKSSLARRDRLTPEQSEKTERLARTFLLAEHVLGGQPEARVFLHRPHPELEGRTPLQAAATELGGRAVERILNSLEYGLPV